MAVFPDVAASQPQRTQYDVQVARPDSLDALCASLLAARREAEVHGRLDFAVSAQASGSETSGALTVQIRPGVALSIGRIHFTGHRSINDATVRRALTIRERDHLDVRQLRHSLDRINRLGLFESIALADITMARLPDRATVDLTIPLRERKQRGWAVSGPALPGMGWLQASLVSRLPPWGRGILETATYLVSISLSPFAQLLFALERPLVPGQWFTSGFALSPSFSPGETLVHYGRTHVAEALHRLLRTIQDDALQVPMTWQSRPESSTLVCTPPKPRLLWLRRGAAAVLDVAATLLLP